MTMQEWKKANPITQWLEESKMPQHELALRCGVSRQSVYAWQSGSTNVGHIASLAKVMKVTQHDLEKALELWKSRLPDEC